MEVDPVPLSVVEYKLAVVKVPVGKVVPAVPVLLPPSPLPDVAGVLGGNKETEALVMTLRPLPAVLGLVGVDRNTLPTVTSEATATDGG